MNAVVVTSENSGEFYAKRLGLDAPEPAAASEPEKVKEEPVKESGKAEAQANPETGAEAEQDSQHPDPEKRQKLNLRFSELSKQAREAKERAEKAESDAKASREARELAEREALELRAKYEPPKTDEIGPKPARNQFANDEEFLAAVEDWAGEKAVREKEQKDRQAAIERQWSERQAAVKAELPDYDDVLKAGASLMVSNEVRDAILESEVGPALLYHLAANPDFVRDLAKKSRTAALREIGKLEVTKPWEAKKAPSSPAKPVAAASEISRAPAPITPLKGGAAVETAKIDSEGRFYGTFAEYKAARAKGLIK